MDGNAEAIIKDFGIVCVDSSGFELHVGGNGGIKVRGTDLLCKVATEEEAIEYCSVFMQFYREEGRYLERTAPWIERVRVRVGLSYMKSRIVEDAGDRCRWFERFRKSQETAQADPWGELAGPVERQAFAPLACLD